MPWVSLQRVIVVFSDHTNFLSVLSVAGGQWRILLNVALYVSGELNCLMWSTSETCVLRGHLTFWLSFVVSNCEFVTFPLVSWVRCGT